MTATMDSILPVKPAAPTHKVNQIDAYNDREYTRAKAAGDTHMKLLHPTKGFRRVSFARQEAAIEGKIGMWRRISAMFMRCTPK